MKTRREVIVNVFADCDTNEHHVEGNRDDRHELDNRSSAILHNRC
jgi:hypothetical protein